MVGGGGGVVVVSQFKVLKSISKATNINTSEIVINEILKSNSRPCVFKVNGACKRDGKTYKRPSNGCVNFFLGWVKSVQNFIPFCRKSELRRDFTFLGVILMAFLVNF